MRVVLMTAAVLGMAANVADALAQADPPRRKPPRIIVTPQPAATPYPVAGVAYPGPGYVRDCVARLIEEHRPSGTVIVPHTFCRWVRGRS
jgi:hypothetical protein